MQCFVYEKTLFVANYPCRQSISTKFGKKSMQRRRLFGLAIVLGSIIIFNSTGCTKEPKYIETVGPSDNAVLVNIDTFYTQFTIDRLDSFMTSYLGSVMAGSHSDPVAGKITSMPIFRFKLPAENPLLGANNIYYDSIALVMRLNRNYYGDTNSVFTIKVHPLTADISNENNLFYNTSDVAASPTPLASTSVRVRPNSNDSIVSVKLPDVFGQQLFTHFRAGSNEVSNNEFFQQYIKGVKIIPDSNTTNVVYGFRGNDSSIAIRIFYHQDVGTRLEKTLDCMVDAGGSEFTRVTSNLSGTVLQSLLPGKKMISDQLGHQFFIRPMSGIRTFINIPSLRDILKIDGYVKVLNANLILRPVKGSYTSYPLFNNLGLFMQQADLTFDGPVSGNTSPIIDNISTENTRYSYDITAYVQQELKTNIVNASTLIPWPATPPSFNAVEGLKRFVGVDGNNANYRSYVQLQLLLYKK